jgi:hypothetical protein
MGWLRSNARVLLGVLFLLATTGSAGAQSQPEYCQADKPTILLVIDVTTEYDDRDRTLLMEAVQHILGKLEGGERIVIRTITDTYTTSDRLFDRCVPVCIPTRRSIFGSGCSTGTITMHRRSMNAALETALRDRLRRFESRDYSDIIRTLSEIGRDIPLAGKPNQVYVFSDMIEHSEFMRGTEFFTLPGAQLIERVRSARLIPALKLARVQVFGVGRSGLAGKPPLSVAKLAKLRDFWTSYFTAAGAASCSITAGLPRP